MDKLYVQWNCLESIFNQNAMFTSSRQCVKKCQDLNFKKKFGIV